MEWKSLKKNHRTGSVVNTVTTETPNGYLSLDGDTTKIFVCYGRGTRINHRCKVKSVTVALGDLENVTSIQPLVVRFHRTGGADGWTWVFRVVSEGPVIAVNTLTADATNTLTTEDLWTDHLSYHEIGDCIAFRAIGTGAGEVIAVKTDALGSGNNRAYTQNSGTITSGYIGATVANDGYAVPMTITSTRPDCLICGDSIAAGSEGDGSEGGFYPYAIGAGLVFVNPEAQTTAKENQNNCLPMWLSNLTGLDWGSVGVGGSNFEHWVPGGTNWTKLTLREPQSALLICGANDIYSETSLGQILDASIDYIFGTDGFVEGCVAADIIPIVGLIPPLGKTTGKTWPWGTTSDPGWAIEADSLTNLHREVTSWNSAIYERAFTDKVSIMDLWSPLVDPDDQRKQKAAFTGDQVHLSSDGYHALATAIRDQGIGDFTVRRGVRVLGD